jgi:type I restriction enzyme, S subunit
MKGWARRPLAQLASRISDGSHNPPKGVEMSGFMMLSSKNVFDDQLSFDAPRYLSAADFKAEDRRTFVSAGDVLLTIVGTIGRTAVVPTDAPAFTLQRSVAVIRPDRSVVDSRFLMYALMSGSEALNAQARGVAQKGIYLEALREFGIDHPPLPEQRRIVAILDEAFEGIAIARANAEKNLQNARELFDSNLDAALSRHGDDLAETTLADEIDLVAGYAFSSKRYTDVADGIRLLRGDNIMQGYLRWDDAKGWPGDDVAPYARFALQQGDVVLAMDRPWVKAGLKRARIGADDLPCLQVQRTARLRPGRGMSVDFLYHLTGSKSFSQHLLSVQTGLGVPHISGKQIESFRFVLPPLSDQEMITGTLDELQRHCECLEGIFEQKASALDELKKSLLHQAFTGAL